MKPEEIGHRLKALRGDKTLWDISKATGIQMPLLSLYENGKRVPSDTNKLILAQYYGQTVQEILTRSVTLCDIKLMALSVTICDRRTDTWNNHLYQPLRLLY